MKIKLIGITVLTSLTLFGCQANNGDEAMNNDGNGLGAERTQYDDNGIDNVGDNMRDENGYNNVDFNNRRNGMNNGDNNGLENGNGNNNGNGLMNMGNRDGNQRYDVGRKVASKITSEVDEVDRAYVLTTENNAYVAVVSDNNTEVNDDLKGEISRVVKEADNDIDNVYVSSNPDFFDMTQGYANDVREGRPIRGFFNEFGQMIDRTFSDVR